MADVAKAVVETNEVNKAIAANKAVTTNEAIEANEVNKTKADEAIIANNTFETMKTNELLPDGNWVDAIYANKANAAAVAGKVDLTTVADNVEEANETSVANAANAKEAIMTNKADVAN